MRITKEEKYRMMRYVHYFKVGVLATVVLGVLSLAIYGVYSLF